MVNTVEIVEDVIPMEYLDMIKYTALNTDAWHMRYPQNHPDKHLKMDIIDGDARPPATTCWYGHGPSHNDIQKMQSFSP